MVSQVRGHRSRTPSDNGPAVYLQAWPTWQRVTEPLTSAYESIAGTFWDIGSSTVEGGGSAVTTELTEDGLQTGGLAAINSSWWIKLTMLPMQSGTLCLIDGHHTTSDRQFLKCCSEFYVSFKHSWLDIYCLSNHNASRMLRSLTKRDGSVNSQKPRGMFCYWYRLLREISQRWLH